MGKREHTDIEKTDLGENSFIADIRAIVSAARDASYRMANLMQVVQNWLVGRRIVEQEQHGKSRAGYGNRVIEMASHTLTEEFCSGFYETHVRSFRKFYLIFNNLQIQQALPAEFKMKLAPIIRCSETNADVARFSSLASNSQMYASKYLTYMPTEEELRREIEQQKQFFLQQHEKE